MFISNNKQVQNMLKAYSNQQLNEKKGVNKKKEGTKNPNLQPDKIDLSAEARDFQAVLKIASNQVEARMDKVNELKRKIESGQYKIDPEQVAAKMIERIISERII
ncbi:MAG TPA: flagellar biosynthesis anti-sigma factor FlgM [Clostridia bacterium]|jgi:negative regulator of flagellin synthesis FlgM|nr:flagellar biosynthesis anti-sigma factor FlgM [Clostridia bacterium]